MHADLLIENAAILDGTGGPAQRASVAVKDGRIVHIGRPVSATRIVEAFGLCLAPGFIDVHTHDDLALIATPDMSTKVRQGVTTVITGLCGYSAAPFPPDRQVPEEYGILLRGPADKFETFTDYLTAVRSARPAINWLPLVGHSTLRVAAMDRLDRPATAAELATMAQLLDDSVAAGAAGLSTGLAYAMAKSAPTAEIIELCRRIAPWGLHVTHIRDEANGLIDAVNEALQIGREAGVGTVFSHHKAIGPAMWGRTRESLAAIDAARPTQDVALDAYPYAFSSTALTPERVLRGGKITITRSTPMPEAAGRDLSDIAAEMGVSMVEAAKALMPAGALYHAMCEDDVARVLSHPLCMIGSDGLPFDPEPHPRLTGTFPRVLERYVRQDGLLSLPEAIHRMTGLPAAVFALKDRGCITVGAIADLVLFDPDRITEAGDHGRPVGVEAVFVAGAPPGLGTGRRLMSSRRAYSDHKGRVEAK